MICDSPHKNTLAFSPALLVFSSAIEGRAAKCEGTRHEYRREEREADIMPATKDNLKLHLEKLDKVIPQGSTG